MQTTTEGTPRQTPRETYLAPRDREQILKAIMTLEDLYSLTGRWTPENEKVKHHISHAYALLTGLVDC